MNLTRLAALVAAAAASMTVASPAVPAASADAQTSQYCCKVVESESLQGLFIAQTLQSVYGFQFARGYELACGCKPQNAGDTCPGHCFGIGASHSYTYTSSDYSYGTMLAGSSVTCIGH